MAFPFVRHTYGLAAPHLSEAEVEGAITAAVAAQRERHPDFERFLPAMEFLSTVLYTDHSRMPLDKYFEALYCTVKHSDFAKPWRDEIRTARRGTPLSEVM